MRRPHDLLDCVRDAVVVVDHDGACFKGLCALVVCEEGEMVRGMVVHREDNKIKQLYLVLEHLVDVPQHRGRLLHGLLRCFVPHSRWSWSWSWS